MPCGRRVKRTQIGKVVGLLQQSVFSLVNKFLQHRIRNKGGTIWFSREVGRFRKKTSCNPRRKKKYMFQRTIQRKKSCRKSAQRKNFPKYEKISCTAFLRGKKYLACSLARKIFLHELNLPTSFKSKWSTPKLKQFIVFGNQLNEN